MILDYWSKLSLLWHSTQNVFKETIRIKYQTILSEKNICVASRKQQLKIHAYYHLRRQFSCNANSYCLRKIFVLFPENSIWNFMQIITSGDNSRAMPNHTVWETQEKCCCFFLLFFFVCLFVCFLSRLEVVKHCIIVKENSTADHRRSC